MTTDSNERKSAIQARSATVTDHGAGQAETIAELRSDEDFVHDVSWLEWLRCDVLRLKSPRARCGVLLVGNPDRPSAMDLGAPMCPRCAEHAGYDQDKIDRFNRRNR